MNKFWLLIILIFFGLSRQATALEISFLPEVTVDGATIKLNDVAKFDSETPLSNALGSQIIGQAPSAVTPLILRAQNIRQYLLSNRPSIADEISWSGSPTIRVIRQGFIVDADKALAIIDEFIANNRKILPKAEIKFTPTTLPIPFTVPKGTLTYDVVPSNPGILSSSSFSIIFKVDDNVVKNLSIRGKLEAMANIIVAAEPLKKGMILKPQHLKNRVIDINEIMNPETSTEHLVGMQLTRNVSIDTPVLAGMVEIVPIVKRGERVKIIVNTGTLFLTASGYALTNGKLDQNIRVQNIQSNKTIVGRVTSPGIVEVVL